MPPKDLVIDEFTGCWIMNPVTGEKEELHILDNVEITPEDIPHGDYAPKDSWKNQNTQFRLLLTNNDRRLHHAPMRRGSVNKRHKQQVKEFWNEQKKSFNDYINGNKVLYYIEFPEEDENAQLP